MKREAAVRFARAALIGALCLCGVTGCVAPVREQLSALQKAPVCCASMREFNYAPLSMSDEKEVTLDVESPAFGFDAGKSFFAAYRLPAWSAPYQIRAEAQPGNVRGGLLAPSALLLDGDFKVTRQFNVAQGPNARPGVVHIFVNESNRSEQYIVFFTAKLAASDGVNAIIAMPTMIAIGTVPVQIGASESRVSLPYSPTGVFQLKVWPYQPARAGQGG